MDGSIGLEVRDGEPVLYNGAMGYFSGGRFYKKEFARGPLGGKLKTIGSLSNAIGRHVIIHGFIGDDQYKRKPSVKVNIVTATGIEKAVLSYGALVEIEPPDAQGWIKTDAKGALDASLLNEGDTVYVKAVVKRVPTTVIKAGTTSKAVGLLTHSISPFTGDIKIDLNTELLVCAKGDLNVK